MSGNHISEYFQKEKPLVDTMTIQRLSKKRGEVLIKILGQYPFITELPDIDEYDFNLPTTSKVEFTPREPKKRPHFNIKGFVSRKREKAVEQKLLELDSVEVAHPLYGIFHKEDNPF